MPPSRTCLDCGDEIPRGRRCGSCGQAAERRRHNAAYDTAEYRTARSVALSAWVIEHGWVCPGDEQHAAHFTRDLTTDHPEALVAGGAIAQEFRIRCRSSNSRRGPGRILRPEGLIVV